MGTTELKKLNGLVSEEALVRSLEVLAEGPGATQKVWSGRGEYDVIPDQAERRKSAELILAFACGKPVAKNVKLNLGDGSKSEQIDAAEVVVALAGRPDLAKVLKHARAAFE